MTVITSEFLFYGSKWRRYSMWISSSRTLKLIFSQTHSWVVIFCNCSETLRTILFAALHIILLYLCFSKTTLLRREISFYKATRHMKRIQTASYNIILYVCECVRPAGHQRCVSTANNTTQGYSFKVKRSSFKKSD